MRKVVLKENRYNDKMVIAVLKKLCKGTCSEAVAEICGISPQYLCDMMKGRRPIIHAVVRKLGFKKVEYYIKTDPKQRGGKFKCM